MRRKSRIAPSIKRKILEESKEKGCNLAEVARKHKISPKLLYGWLRKIRLSDESLQGRFAEVSFSSKQVLKKAVLEFSEVAISVEGNISSKQVLRVVEIFEKQC